MRKINIYINGRYVCSTNKNRTCKAAKNAVLDRGFIQWAGIGYPARLERLEIKNGDTVKAHFCKY